MFVEDRSVEEKAKKMGQICAKCLKKCANKGEDAVCCIPYFCCIVCSCRDSKPLNT